MLSAVHRLDKPARRELLISSPEPDPVIVDDQDLALVVRRSHPATGGLNDGLDRAIRPVILVGLVACFIDRGTVVGERNFGEDRVLAVVVGKVPAGGQRRAHQYTRGLGFSEPLDDLPRVRAVVEQHDLGVFGMFKDQVPLLIRGGVDDAFAVQTPSNNLIDPADPGALLDVGPIVLGSDGGDVMDGAA